MTLTYLLMLLNAARPRVCTCLPVSTTGSVCLCKDTWQHCANCTSSHLELVASFSRTAITLWAYAGGKGGMPGNKNLQLHPPPFSVLRTGSVGAVPAAQEKTPLVWESLWSANGRQTPQRAVEIAWKRLKRDPDSVVSLAFHCSWQIQEGTLLMKTLKKHWMLMKTNNLVPRCSWHRLRHDGRRKVLVKREIISKLSHVAFTRRGEGGMH